MGFEEVFKIRRKERLKARLDVVNITDNIYELRNGSGVGVNAAQYGMRLGIFGTSVTCFEQRLAPCKPWMQMGWHSGTS